MSQFRTADISVQDRIHVLFYITNTILYLMFLQAHLRLVQNLIRLTSSMWMDEPKPRVRLLNHWNWTPRGLEKARKETCSKKRFGDLGQPFLGLQVSDFNDSKVWLEVLAHSECTGDVKIIKFYIKNPIWSHIYIKRSFGNPKKISALMWHVCTNIKYYLFSTFYLIL